MLKKLTNNQEEKPNIQTKCPNTNLSEGGKEDKEIQNEKQRKDI